MKYDGPIENLLLRRPLYVHTKSPREQPLQNNHKHGSRPKEFNKNKNTSKNIGPPQATIPCPIPKAN